MKNMFATGKQVWDKTLGKALALVFVGLIRSYQIILSPRIGQVCRYYPSCSHYALVAVKVHGAGKGVLLAVWRILRCHPWAAGGVEFIPEKGHWFAREVIESSTNSDRQVRGA